jgi:hypothetical protein
MLPVVRGCETWSLMLREERGIRVLESKALRKTFGPRRGGKTGLDKERCDLYFSPNIRLIKTRMRWWAGHVARTERGKVCIGL